MNSADKWLFRLPNIALLLLILSFSLMLFFAGCTSVDTAYRDLPMSSEQDCIPIDSLIEREKLGSRNEERAYRRYLERVKISTFRDSLTCTSENSYLMSFIELREEVNGPVDLKTAEETFDDPTKRATLLLEPDQLADLEQALLNRDVYVIAFVHGWRIDAGNNSSDLAKFHIYLHYARNYLNQRCKDAARYCSTDLVGVFVSWRGRSFDEPHIGFDIVRDNARKPFIFTAGAAPTIWDRKRQSEIHASTVIGLMRRLQSRLTLDGPAGTGDRMLVMGHSLGGNMLATGIRQIAVDAVYNHNTGTAMDRILGNLLLLVNPASEADKWTSIQREMRLKAGAPLDRAVDTSSSSQRLSEWSEMFPRSQRPVYISMTSPCNWSPKEDVEGIERTASDCDRATGILFPLAHSWRRDHQRTAIGHMLPEYQKGSRTAVANPYGATHEFTIINGQDAPTSIESAAEQPNTGCATADGWLSDIRSHDGGWDRWDTINLPDRITTGVRGDRPIRVQFRRGVSPRGLVNVVGEKRAVVPGNVPFWNVRAHYTSFKTHTGMLNNPTWCAINQIVLDEITDH